MTKGKCIDILDEIGRVQVLLEFICQCNIELEDIIEFPDDNKADYYDCMNAARVEVLERVKQGIQNVYNTIQAELKA